MSKPDRFSNTHRLMLSAVAALCLLCSCEFDQGLGPSKTKITGRVVFVDVASRPDNIDEVRVVATASLPPAGFGDVYFSNPVRFDADTAIYEIAVPVGKYQAIGVLWKPRGRDWSFTNLLGIYGLQLPLNIEVKSVELTKQQPIAENVDLYALWSFAQFNARIEGEMTLRGTWPADTEIVLLGAFVNVPDLSNAANLLAGLGGLPLPISDGAEQRSYGIAVRSGEYKFIALFWKGKNTAWEDIRLLGYYRNPQDASKPGSVVVSSQGGVSEINFVADFATLPAGLPLPERQ